MAPRRRRKRIRFVSGTVAYAKSRIDRAQNRKIRRLQRALKPEEKFVDQVNFTGTVSNSYSSVLTRPLTFIAQGNNDNERIGNKIKIKSHQIRVIMTAADTTNLYRLMVVRFGTALNASIGVQHVLEHWNDATPFNLLSAKKRNTQMPYKILYDSGVKKLALTAENAEMAQRVHWLNLRPSKKSHPGGWLTVYDDATAGSCTTGFTYLIACSDSSIAPHVGVQSTARTIFTG